MPLAPGQTIGRYRVVRLLREGQAAESYLALADDAQVLLKLYKSDVIEVDSMPALQALAEQLAAANCPHLVPLSEVAFGQDLDRNRALLARPWIDGRSLAEQMARTPIFELTEIHKLAAALLRALDQVHALGIAVQSLRPANVIWGSDGTLRFTDAGFWLEDESETAMFQYLAPEQQAGGDGSVTADLYSVGVVLYKALTGSLPFPASAPEHLLQHKISSNMASIPRGGRLIVRLVTTLLVPDPSVRPQSALATLAMLEAADASPASSGEFLVAPSGTVTLTASQAGALRRLPSIPPRSSGRTLVPPAPAAQPQVAQAQAQVAQAQVAQSASDPDDGSAKPGFDPLRSWPPPPRPAAPTANRVLALLGALAVAAFAYLFLRPAARPALIEPPASGSPWSAPAPPAATVAPPRHTRAANRAAPVPRASATPAPAPSASASPSAAAPTALPIAPLDAPSTRPAPSGASGRFEDTPAPLADLPSGQYAVSDETGRVRPVALPAYRVETVPVTNARFARFWAATARRGPALWRAYYTAGREQQPVRGVSWQEAADFCRWARLRLPAAREWEHAVRMGAIAAASWEWTADHEGATAVVRGPGLAREARPVRWAAPDCTFRCVQ